MQLPLKLLVPAHAIEHMADWQTVSLSLGIEQDGSENKADGYAVGVLVVVNPALAKALETQSVADPLHVGRQVLLAAKEAVCGFLGTERTEEQDDSD